jgi:signal transduction histidine kinase
MRFVSWKKRSKRSGYLVRSLRGESLEPRCLLSVGTEPASLDASISLGEPAISTQTVEPAADLAQTAGDGDGISTAVDPAAQSSQPAAAADKPIDRPADSAAADEAESSFGAANDLASPPEIGRSGDFSEFHDAGQPPRAASPDIAPAKGVGDEVLLLVEARDARSSVPRHDAGKSQTAPAEVQDSNQHGYIETPPAGDSTTWVIDTPVRPMECADVDHRKAGSAGAQATAPQAHAFAVAIDENSTPAFAEDHADREAETVADHATTADVDPGDLVAAAFTWWGVRNTSPIAAGLIGEGRRNTALETATSVGASLLLAGAPGAALSTRVVGDEVRVFDAKAAGPSQSRATKGPTKLAAHGASHGSLTFDETDESLLGDGVYPKGDPTDDADGIPAAQEIVWEHVQTIADELLEQIGPLSILQEERNERRRLEAELAQVKEQLARHVRLATVGQAAASIAHDLRNPLAVVRVAAQCLKRHLPDDAKPQSYLVAIDAEVADANRIIDNLMEAVRAKEPIKESIELAATLTGVFERLQHRGDVRLSLDCNPATFPVHADPVQLRQVLGNLLGNAVEAMDGQGEITVQARREDAMDSIVVRDQGPGIPPEIRQTLFEPLTSTRAKGTGLGLAICRQIVERHGGTIELLPTDEGAAFLIRLPRTTE